MSILAEIIIIISIIFANICTILFAKKTSSKLISILTSVLFLILLCTISFDDFDIVRDLIFALVGFFIAILLIFFVPKISIEEKYNKNKFSIFAFITILSAFFLFIVLLLNIDDFHKPFLEKTTKERIFVSSHFDDEPIKEFYLNKKNNLSQLEKENIREFKISNNKILREKLTQNPLLYRFSEIVLLSALFVILLYQIPSLKT